MCVCVFLGGGFSANGTSNAGDAAYLGCDCSCEEAESGVCSCTELERYRTGGSLCAMEELEALLGQGPKGSELWRVAFSPFDSFEHAENEFPFFLQHVYVFSWPSSLAHVHPNQGAGDVRRQMWARPFAAGAFTLPGFLVAQAFYYSVMFCVAI